MKAAEKYREALALWDHPAIHYNLALALLNLDQPHRGARAPGGRPCSYGAAPLDIGQVRARPHLQGARREAARQGGAHLRGGPAPRVIDGRQGRLRGPRPLRGAGAPRRAHLRRLEGWPRAHRPEPHAAARREDHAGPQAVHRRGAHPVPAPLVGVEALGGGGGGAALAAGGGVLHLQAKGSYDDFDDRASPSAAAACPRRMSPTCAPAETACSTLAYGAYAVGGAAVVTGRRAHLHQPFQAVPISPNDAAREPDGVTRHARWSAGEGGASWRPSASEVPYELHRCFSRPFAAACLARAGAAGPAAGLVLRAHQRDCAPSGLVCPEGRTCAANQPVCIAHGRAATASWTRARPVTTATSSTEMAAARTARRTSSAATTGGHRPWERSATTATPRTETAAAATASRRSCAATASPTPRGRGVRRQEHPSPVTAAAPTAARTRRAATASSTPSRARCVTTATR